MRLDKFICRSTTYSRFEAIHFIESGAASVNDAVITDVTVQVHEDNQISLKGETLTLRTARYIMLHKPASMICSNVDQLYPSVLNLLEGIEGKEYLHIAGRLDADTTGLILITDDGRWSFSITSPKQRCEKQYRVQLRQALAPEAATKLEQGVLLQGESTPTRPATLTCVEDKEVLLTITEGKFHQVKRMFKAVGNKVVNLHRERIGPVSLDIPEGQWRFLTDGEVEAFCD